MSKLQSLLGEMIQFYFEGCGIQSNFRPSWMNGLELDFYIPEKRLAFEIQGAQHFLYSPTIQNSVQEFIKQRENDKRKVRLCNKLGIKLIRANNKKQLMLFLRKHIGSSLPTLPKELNSRSEAHRRDGPKYQKSMIAFKMTKKGFIPINKASKTWLSENSL